MPIFSDDKGSFLTPVPRIWSELNTQFHVKSTIGYLSRNRYITDGAFDTQFNTLNGRYPWYSSCYGKQWINTHPRVCTKPVPLYRGVPLTPGRGGGVEAQCSIFLFTALVVLFCWMYVQALSGVEGNMVTWLALNSKRVVLFERKISYNVFWNLKLFS